MVMSVIVVLGVKIPALGGCARFAIILVDMMIVLARAAWARARPRTRTWRRSGTRSTPSSGWIVGAWQRGLVIMHGLVALVLDVIALAIILLVIGLGALWVLVIALRAIVVLIVLMTIVGSVIVAVALVASMVVVIFTTAILMVAWFMATRGRKMSCFLFLRLLVLGVLLKNASRLVGCLTLLKEGDHLERVSRHCLV
jgi:hypothetical protein